ncbi:nucleoside triphosphate pyrophosphohydrolase [Akkermansiaceae bacterium]|nr:nucleoside triphosphate pyrophosphohydrolase [Akkermansiaceae bacterium]
MTDHEMMNCAEPGRQIERLRAIMHRLRAPGGCPWDAEQSHESIISNLIEETYETVAAIKAGDDVNLEEELGDVLLQVVFHAEIAQEDERFDLDSIARGISDKLVRRHPHVYGASEVSSTNGVLMQWEEIKRAEKGDQEKSYLHSVGNGLPALLKSAKLQKKAGKIGFDWPGTDGIVEKIEEEFGEVKEELAKHQVGEPASAELQAEIGDLLFIVTNLARKLGVDPEVALEGTNQKFLDRFAYIEACLKRDDISLEDATLEKMNGYWNEMRKA